jgi:septal ring factor EnvC (AmiA/AmiB activator)
MRPLPRPGWALLALGLLATPLAPAVPARAEAGQSLEAHNFRLESLRQEVVDRRALRLRLDREANALDAILAAVASEQAHNRSALVRLQDLARRLDQESDRRVPRLGLRLAALKAARLADARRLAAPPAASGVSLGAETRARLLTSDPGLLERLRRVTASLRLLSRRPADLLARQDQVAFRLPLLQATHERLAREERNAARRRTAVAARIERLDGELAKLAAQERRLQASLAQLVGIGAASLPDPAAAAGGNVADKAASTTPALVAGWGFGSRASLRSNAAMDGPATDNYEIAFLESAPTAAATARVGLAKLEEPGPPLKPDPINLSGDLADGEAAIGRTAVAISAQPRQRVAAPADGRVVFASDFRSYGLLLIIEHDSEYHTLMWGFSTLNVVAGTDVHGGQIVGMIGASPSPKLYVELRRNGRPVSPQAWLAASSSGIKG